MKVLLITMGLALALLASMTAWMGYRRRKEKRHEKTKISIKESMDLCSLPVITFTLSGKKFNFLLDTGSNVSYINRSVLKGIEHTPIDSQCDAYGFEGTTSTMQGVAATMEYNGNFFLNVFYAADLDKSFGNMKKDHGVQLHGIIGSLFMNKYKYVIDFDRLIAYSRK